MGTSSVTAEEANVEISVADPGEEPTGRTLVYEEDFSPGYQTRIDWFFLTENSDIIFADHPNFNGFGGLDVTYPAGSLANRRWGGSIKLPNFPLGYPEGWFSFDVMLNSPYSIPIGQKMPGVYPNNRSWSFTASPVPPCDQGWLARFQAGRSHEEFGANNAGDFDDLNASKGGQLYSYDNIATRRAQHWPRVGGSEPRVGDGIFELDVVNRIELFWKKNTAFNVDNAQIIHRWNPGTSSTHAVPTTIRAQRLDTRHYCGSEDGQLGSSPPGNVGQISISTFFGGPTSTAWAPTVNSKLTIGRIAIEVPA